jgi:hypothetical protein
LTPYAPAYSQVVDGAPTLKKKRGMTVPYTENPLLLQTKSSPEVLERHITTKCTWHTADVKGPRKSMSSRSSAPGSLEVNEKSLATMLVFTTEPEAPPNRKHHRTDRMENRLQPTMNIVSTAPSTSDQKARYISN